MKKLSPLFTQAFTFALSYGIAFYVLQFFLFKTSVVAIRPGTENLLSWDVSFYNSIKEHGYDHVSHNTGFFILFPLIWKISHLNVWGICLLNVVFFAAGFALLMRMLKEDDKIVWLFLLTLPPVFYAFIPLTEALFFLLAVLSMLAIREKKLWLIWLSLFLMALVRASTVFLLPALFTMELLTHPLKLWYKSILTFLYKYCLPSLVGLGLFIYYQYLETGIWLAYFKTQAEHWEKKFSMPQFPLRNIEGGEVRYHWLNALALFIALVGIFMVLRSTWFWFKGRVVEDGMLIYSAVFLGMVLIFILFFNPKYGGEHTLIMGSNRYIMVTPFCFYLLAAISRQKVMSVHIWCTMAAAGLFWALFNAYFDLSNFIIIGLMPTMLILAFLFFSFSKKKHTWLMIGIIAFNLLIQLLFFQQFITPKFMD